FKLFKWSGEYLVGHFVALDGDREAERQAKWYLGGPTGVGRGQVWSKGRLVWEGQEGRRKQGGQSGESGSDLISDTDIRRAAEAIIRHSGHRAVWRARSRALELRDDGDIGGAETWQRIAKAIEDLRKPK